MDVPHSSPTFFSWVTLFSPDGLSNSHKIFRLDSTRKAQQILTFHTMNFRSCQSPGKFQHLARIPAYFCFCSNRGQVLNCEFELEVWSLLIFQDPPSIIFFSLYKLWKCYWCDIIKDSWIIGQIRYSGTILQSWCISTRYDK